MDHILPVRSLSRVESASSAPSLRVTEGHCLFFVPQSYFSTLITRVSVMPVSSSSVFLLLVLLSALHRGWCAHIASVLLPFTGLVRERLLYTEGKTHGLFLEMSADGSVRGSSTQTSNCVLELRAMRAGHTVIRGVATSLFLCVNRAGHLRGQWLYAEKDCLFQELLVNSYTRFLSPHTGHPVSLSSKQSGQKHAHMLSNFLPLLNTWFMVRRVEEEAWEGGGVQVMDLDSDDPLRLPVHSVHSPAMHRRK